VNVGLMLNGFLKNKNNLNTINKFLNKNNKHKIDIYTETYNIIGLETKESSDVSEYLQSNKCDEETFSDISKNYNHILYTEDYIEANKIANNFVKNNLDITTYPDQKNLWRKLKQKSGYSENEHTHLSRSYSQWRKVYRCYNLIQDPNQYDLLIRCRCDYRIDNLDLDYYRNITTKDICMKTKTYSKFTFDTNQKFKHMVFDGLAIGKPQAMKHYCNHGSEEEFIKRMNTDTYASKEHYRIYGYSSRLSNEVCISHWCYSNGYDLFPIHDSHLPSKAVLRQRKY